MDIEYKIVPLPKEKWKGTPIHMAVESDEFYDVTIEKQAEGYTVSLIKKQADPPVKHTIPGSLYEEYFKNAQAWGVVETTNNKDSIVACIETCPEEWSNRLMVTGLWVHEKIRRQGIGHRLMEIAKRQAVEEGRRALILETQSCNANAIGFYMHEGFELIGFDSCCYTNNDIRRREVRLDLGIILDGFTEKRDQSVIK